MSRLDGPRGANGTVVIGNCCSGASTDTVAVRGLSDPLSSQRQGGRHWRLVESRRRDHRRRHDRPPPKTSHRPV